MERATNFQPAGAMSPAGGITSVPESEEITSTANPVRESLKHTICANYVSERGCSFGPNCRRAHTLLEFTPGECTMGKKCFKIKREGSRYYNKRETNLCTFKHQNETKSDLVVRLFNEDVLRILAIGQPPQQRRQLAALQLSPTDFPDTLTHHEVEHRPSVWDSAKRSQVFETTIEDNIPIAAKTARQLPQAIEVPPVVRQHDLDSDTELASEYEAEHDDDQDDQDADDTNEDDEHAFGVHASGENFWGNETLAIPRPPQIALPPRPYNPASIRLQIAVYNLGLDSTNQEECIKFFIEAKREAERRAKLDEERTRSLLELEQREEEEQRRADTFNSVEEFWHVMDQTYDHIYRGLDNIGEGTYRVLNANKPEKHCRNDWETQQAAKILKKAAEEQAERSRIEREYRNELRAKALSAAGQILDFIIEMVIPVEIAVEELVTSVADQISEVQPPEPELVPEQRLFSDSPALSARQLWKAMKNKRKIRAARSGTTLCDSVYSGLPCGYGDRCMFAHSEAELRTQPCLNGTRCRFVRQIGEIWINTMPNICEFSHPGESNEDLRVRLNQTPPSVQTIPFKTLAEPVRVPRCMALATAIMLFESGYHIDIQYSD